MLGIPVDDLTLAEAAEACEAYCGQAYDGGAGEPAETRLVVTLNVEMAMDARSDEALREALFAASLRVADSVGIQWAGRMNGRCPGIDLLGEIFSRASERKGSFFFYGAAPGVAQAAADKVLAKYPGIIVAGTHHGYVSPGGEEAELIAAIRAARPDYLLVALGAGRQEGWIYRHRKNLGAAVAIGVGGSLDVISGKTQRAPKWAQRLNIEWLYRITTQPSRLGRAMALPRFVLVILRQRLLKRAV